MYLHNPIFTEKTVCQDCYKCLRRCEVKAIRVEQGSAQVLPKACTLCGLCVAVCPVGAKKVRDDSARLGALRERKKELIAVAAPSFFSEFPGLSWRGFEAAVRALGFYALVPAAYGADLVNRRTLEVIRARNRERRGGLLISSACPTVVLYLQRYRPDLVDSLVSLLSPMQVSAWHVKKRFPDAGVVFFGPCIAKKKEADDRPDLVDLSLSFRDLETLWAKAGIDPFAPPEAEFESRDLLPKPEKGLLYPLEGGMIAGLKRIGRSEKFRAMAFTGMEHIKKALDGLGPEDCAEPLVLELMACESGCINGPLSRSKNGTIVKRLKILDEYSRGEKIAASFPGPEESADSGMDGQRPNFYREAAVGGEVGTGAPEFRPGFRPDVSDSADPDELSIRKALASVGKSKKENELNCSACGYETCRDFAKAMLVGRAETTMCVSYMRNLVQKKANALLRTMPSGVVIVDRELRIVESNRAFAHLVGGETEELFELKPGLEGADGSKMLPCPRLFRAVLDEESDFLEQDVRAAGRILHASVFSIEDGTIAGGIFQDVTKPTVRRDRVVSQAKKVIERNLAVVQKIAYLLGENAAESEAILSSIIDSFSVSAEEKPREIKTQTPSSGRAGASGLKKGRNSDSEISHD